MKTSIKLLLNALVILVTVISCGPPEQYEKGMSYYNIQKYDSAMYYFGRGDAILTERKRIKKLTLLARRKEYEREILSQSFENQNKINSFKSARNSN